MFDSRRSRGIAIGVASATLLVGGTALSIRAGSELDERASRKEAFLKARLPATDPLDLLTAADASDLIGSYRAIRQLPDGGVEVSVEVRAGWRTRCLVAVRPPGPHEVTVRAVAGRCP